MYPFHARHFRSKQHKNKLIFRKFMSSQSQNGKSKKERKRRISWMRLIKVIEGLH
jgi:hypothetical protein